MRVVRETVGPPIEESFLPEATTPPPQQPAVVEREHAAWTGPPPVAAAIREAPAPSTGNGKLPIKALLVDCAPLQGDVLQVINLATLAHGIEPAELGAFIDQLDLPDEAAIVMSMRTPEGQQAFEALAARAELVIRGF